MTLTKYSHPLNLLFDLHSNFGDIFREPYGKAPAGLLNPAVEIVEKDEDYTITAELPGIAKEDIDVKISEGVLTVKATKKAETHREDGKVKYTERQYGEFSRAWSLPDTVDQEEVTANFQDGVLKLTIKKVKPAPPKEKAISIN